MNTAIKVLGVSDEVLECGCCGKTNLKKTVVLQFETGADPVFYGTDCAAAAIYGRKSAKNSKLVTTAAQMVEVGVKLMKSGKTALECCEIIQGRWGYNCNFFRNALYVAGIYIQSDGTLLRALP